MRHYEVAIVLHPDLEMDQERGVGKVEMLITSLGGKIDKKDNWGKRKLAYTIKKQDWGIYVFYQITLDPSQVQSLEQTLRITDEVMRYLIVSLENQKAIQKPKDEQDKKSTQAIKAQSAEDKSDSKPDAEETEDNA